MSAITIENDLVHYEVLGRGRPVILVHGWLGSWRYWIPAMQQLSLKYRTYALDLWGFGDSGKDPRRYGFPARVALLDQFMEKMGIGKAALIGHGLGAAIVVRYAARFPDRVPRLMVIAPPLFRMAPDNRPLTLNPPPPERLASGKQAAGPDVHPEAETMPFRNEELKARLRAAIEQRENGSPDKPKSPREAAIPPTDRPATAINPALPSPLPEIPQMPRADLSDPREAEVQKANPLKEHLQVLDPLLLLERHVDSGADLEKLKVEVGKADRVAVAVGVESFAGVDTLRELRALPMPAVTVFGTHDTFMPPPDAEMLASLKEGRSTFHAIPMEDCRHFPMLEAMAPFTRMLLDFLEVPDVTKLEIKKTWERRVR